MKKQWFSENSLKQWDFPKTVGISLKQCGNQDPDPYHGGPLPVDPLRPHPLPRVHPPPGYPAWQHVYTPAWSHRAHTRPPGFFRIQSGTQHIIWSKTTTVLFTRNGPVKIDVFWDSDRLRGWKFAILPFWGFLTKMVVFWRLFWSPLFTTVFHHFRHCQVS